MKTVWFDDGHASTFTVAYPIMKARGHIGIIALVTGMVGKFWKLPSAKRGPYQFLTVKQLLELIEEGWEVASHTVTHPFRFDLLSVEDTVHELEESKKWIEEKLGIIPLKFVVPRHLIRENQMEIVRRYYPYIRPLGNPIKGHKIFHWISEGRSFERRLGYKPT